MQEPFDLFRANIPRGILELIQEEIVRTERIIPIREEGDVLTLATANTDSEAAARIEFILNRPVNVVRVSPNAIDYAIRRYYQISD